MEMGITTLIKKNKRTVEINVYGGNIRGTCSVVILIIGFACKCILICMNCLHLFSFVLAFSFLFMAK